MNKEGPSNAERIVTAKTASNNEKRQRHECSICHKTYKTNCLLNKHKRIHTEERPYGCAECDKTYSSPSGLYSHKLVHSGEKPFKCSICKMSFYNPSTLGRHFKVHSGDKNFECSVCLRKFHRQDQLNVHKRQHTGDNSKKPRNLSTTVTGRKCPICEKTFESNRKLRNHCHKHPELFQHECL